MIGNFFSSLGAKIFGASTLVLLIALGVQTLRLSGARDDLKDEKAEHRATTAERDRFRDALAFFVKDGTIRVERGQQALKDHAGVSADLQRQANKIRTWVVTVPGDCRTPAEVMGASGL